MTNQTFPYYSANTVYNNGKSYQNLFFDEGFENNVSGGYSDLYQLKDHFRNRHSANNRISIIANTVGL